MTQTNTQSVRSDAEAAVNTNRVPTFEEVYAMPYVQDSIRALIDQNVRQYPILASHEDDLRQELLIAIWKELPQFDPARASLRTYLRTVLRSSIIKARREYFTETNLALAYAEDISNFDFCDEDSIISKECRQTVVQLAQNPMELEMLRQDVAAVLKNVPADQREVAQRIMAGESLREIGRSLGLDHRLVKLRYVIPLREAFEKYF